MSRWIIFRVELDYRACSKLLASKIRLAGERESIDGQMETSIIVFPIYSRLRGGFRQVLGRFGQVWASFRRIWRGVRAI